MTNEQIAQDEIKRLKKLLLEFGISERKIELLEPVIQNTAWMKVKLDETREIIKTSGVVITYDNGGGQKGIRENPLYKGYESLYKSYMSGMTKIIDCIPDTHKEVKEAELERPKTMLEIIKTKKALNEGLSGTKN